MNRNQKIALGCGGAGCLGIILVVVVCVILAVAGYITLPGISSNYNDNTNSNSNRNSNVNSNSNNNSISNPTTSSSEFSNDEKHKLIQAAGFTQDTELIQRVLRRLGFLTSDNQVSPDYAPFLKEHSDWAIKNYRFVQSVNTKEKARAYVEEHIND